MMTLITAVKETRHLPAKENFGHFGLTSLIGKAVILLLYYQW